MQVSFIIPHKGRFEMLKQTLQSISQQSCDLQTIEVIVVSQTPEIQKQTLLDNPSLNLRVYIRPENNTISALRNYGVTQAQGQFLAFLDADIWLSKNWTLQMMAELTTNSNRIISSAKQICHDDAPPLEKIRTSLSNAEIDTDVAFLPGRNLFLTQTSFDKIGGFPEHLITCEDYFFTDQAAKLGKLYYTSAATYVHLGEDKAYKAMFDKEIWRGQSNLQSISGRNIPFREWPSFIAPPAILLLFSISLLLLVLGQLSLALVAFLVAALPIFVYSLRLYALADKKIKFIHIVKFYVYYFPARAIGTVLGLFKSIGVKTH
ncbi:glycosyltransferase [Paraglaciecola arctica]|uniref:glycosyltransferase n=1 Tax=Paraglaciecola arctica TaxID=1128911 RepID=UPI001C0748F6|nr:glycosyltransferase family A protein [Paraglaciecola arctica]MBU3005708.1 glycosyltransferase family 2 protein [Paraglaciecola arctica]